MSRQNPIVAIEKGLVAIGVGFGGWFLQKIGYITTSSEEMIENTNVFGIAYSSVTGVLASLYKIIINFPGNLKTLFTNFLVFVYIFCILVVIGQFDWLLNDLYALVALSAVLTYVTYR